MENNYQNGYPQQQGGYVQSGMQNGYNQPMQNGYNQPIQNGYNQPMQNGYNQPMQNGYNQPMNGYNQPMNGYNQPQGLQGGYNQTGNQKPTKPSKSEKKGHAGFIIGIIIAALVIAAGVLVFVFRDRIFKTNAKGGYDSPEELAEAFWIGMSNCDEDKIASCFPDTVKNFDALVKKEYDLALDIKDDMVIDVSGMMVKTDKCNDDFSDIKPLKEAKSIHMEVPMEQTINGVAYNIVDIFDGVAIKLNNGKWYLYTLDETDVILLSDPSSETSEDSSEEESTEEVTEEVTTEDLTEEVTEEEYYEEVKTFGNEIDGYVDVASDWVTFVEEGGIDGTVSYYQCSAPSQNAIITVCTFDNENDAGATADNLYNNLLEEDGTTDHERSFGYIDNYEAEITSCYYENQDVYFVVWLLRTPDRDNYLHYIAVEYTSDLWEAEYYIWNTYRFN